MLPNPPTASGAVVAADQAVIEAECVLKLEAKCCPNSASIEVNKVKYIPGMSNNLLSVSQIVSRDHKVLFRHEGVKSLILLII